MLLGHEKPNRDTCPDIENAQHQVNTSPSEDYTHYRDRRSRTH